VDICGGDKAGNVGVKQAYCNRHTCRLQPLLTLLVTALTCS